jgi:hypothetical protein
LALLLGEQGTRRASDKKNAPKEGS